MTVMQNDLNELAVSARTDSKLREKLIREHEQTILRMASRAAGHYVTKSDDEWSVALYAFSRAIDSYEDGKGDFLGYAQLLIRRELIDEYRRNARYAPEVSTASHVLEGNAEPEEDPDKVAQAVARKSMEEDAAAGSTLPEEIEEVNARLRQFGFSFYDLTDCSPKQDRTRDACAVVIRWLLQEPLLCTKLCASGQLPAAAIRKGTGATEKLLEHYRKYLIAAVVILQGEYPGLQEYLKYVRKGG